jgi:hypothetical protein
MKRLTVMVLALAVLAGSGMATSFLGRSSTMNKQYQFFGWTNFGYNQTALSYNWTSGKYETPDGFVPTKTTSCDLTLAFGLSEEFDIDVVAPLAMKQKGDAKSAGLGDLMVYARYGVLRSAEQPMKVALLLGANFPTADKKASPALSDRTTDVAFGFSLNTKKCGKFLGHVRAAYWFNGDLPDVESETKVGDMFEYLLCGDYSVTKTVTPELALSGYIRDNTVWGGTWVPKSEVSQHLASLLVMWKPIPRLTIRPKVSVPLTFISQGGAMANIYGGLDIWVTFP